jgi:hypothetical protein
MAIMPMAVECTQINMRQRGSTRDNTQASSSSTLRCVVFYRWWWCATRLCLAEVQRSPRAIASMLQQFPDQFGSPQPAPDMQRMWDLSQLQYKLSEMQEHVAYTDESFQYREAVATGATPGGGYSNVGATRLIGSYDLSELRIIEGFVFRKGAGDGASRQWRQKYMRLEGSELVASTRPDDKQQLRFKLDSNTVVTPGEGRLEPSFWKRGAELCMRGLCCHPPYPPHPRRPIAGAQEQERQVRL